MKMPGPKGVITVGSSIEHAFDCDVECVEHTEALVLDEALVASLEKLVNEDLDSTANRRAVAGHHDHPPTSPTAHAAAAPEKACPPRITVATTASLERPGPSPSEDEPRAARAQGSENPTLDGCKYRPVVLKPAQQGGRHRCPRELLISDSWAEPILEPSSLADAKSREHPAATPQWPY
jgi:hypothetical protein